MPSISIPCPACKATLKLPDNSLIGKKAKCPKCSHRFVLALPEEEEVPLQLADIPVLPLAPRMGTSARWVPDDIPVAPMLPNPLPAPVLPVASAGSRPASASEPAVASPLAEGLPDILAFSPGSSQSTPTAELDFATSPAAPLRTAQKPSVKKRRRGNKAGLIAMAVVTVLVAGGGYAAYLVNQNRTTQVKQAPAVNAGWEQKKVELAASNESAESLSPTSGKPIPLDYLPFTPHLICHIHPDALWKKNDRVAQEFVAVLGDVAIWLSDQMQSRTRFLPEEISELTFAVNFGPRMSLPDVALVVRLKESVTERQFQEKLKETGAKRGDDPQVDIFTSADTSYLLIDEHTFAVAPAALAEDLEMSRKDAAMASPDMEPLLQESDRDRLVTILFDLKILDSHREDIFLTSLQTVADKFILWLGNEVETVSWSMHLEPHFFMETLLHNSSDSSVLKVQRHAQLQLSRLAEEMLAGVRKMRPSTAGSRQMIGRFPAMLNAVDIATTTHVAPTCARLVTVLPRQAAVNLAAGTRLTWYQSLQTNFEDDKDMTKSDGPAVPERIVDRLQMKVLVDFRRTPLQEAFGYIGESIKTEVTIDGDALKGAGFTQNMPQTFDLGTVTAQAALHEIILKYAKERDPLVLIVDEKGKKLTLSTRVKAEADGLTVFDTAPKP